MAQIPDYQPTVWVNDAPPDINSTNLNKIEQRLDLLTDNANALDSKIDTQSSSASVQAELDAHEANTSNPHLVTSRQAGGRYHVNAAERGAVGDYFTDNTAILQACLDEIYVKGCGGELYIPNDCRARFDDFNNPFGGSIYRTRGLWVPPNVRIVSEGAAMYLIGQSVDYRTVVAGNLQFANALFTLQPWTHNVLAPAGGSVGVSPSRVMIEGFVFNCTNAGLSFADIKGAKDVTIQDCVWNPSGVCFDGVAVQQYNAVGVTNENIRLRNLQIRGARRNGISIIQGSGVWVEDCVIENTVLTSNQNPGEGIDIENDDPSMAIQDIVVRGCIIRNNAGAGIGFSLHPNIGYPTTARNFRITDCTISGNGGNPLGGASGGIYIQGGENSANSCLHITGCDITDNSGAGIQGHPTEPIRLRILASACNFRGNSGGTISAPVGYAGGGGFDSSASV